jgi:hypothetical protein
VSGLLLQTLHLSPDTSEGTPYGVTTNGTSREKQSQIWGRGGKGAKAHGHKAAVGGVDRIVQNKPNFEATGVRERAAGRLEGPYGTRTNKANWEAG